LIRMKEIRDKTANDMESINFQLKISKKIFWAWNRFPDISFRSPKRTIEHAVDRQYTNTSDKVNSIIFIKGKVKLESVCFKFLFDY